MDSCAEIKINIIIHLQWRNQIWQSLEEGAGKRCWECALTIHCPAEQQNQFTSEYTDSPLAFRPDIAVTVDWALNTQLLTYVPLALTLDPARFFSHHLALVPPRHNYSHPSASTWKRTRLLDGFTKGFIYIFLQRVMCTELVMYRTGNSLQKYAKDCPKVSSTIAMMSREDHK